jgi:alkaline phosphatase D
MSGSTSGYLLFADITGYTAYLSESELGHSVHTDVTGLAPDRWYFYRFQSGDARSPTGRTRTAPAADAESARLKFAIGSCQHFEQGWYTAHLALKDEGLDLCGSSATPSTSRSSSRPNGVGPRCERWT